MLSLVIIFIIFLIKHCNGIKIPNNPGGTGKRQEGIRSKDPIGSGIFYVGGIITSFTNIVGCLIVISIIYNRWKKNKSKRLSTSQRFPFYMSIMDLSIALITIPNLIYPMQNDKLLNSGGLCEGIGFSMSMLIIMNMMLMTVISLITYLRICKRYILDLGKHDCLLGIAMIIPSLLISILTIVPKGYGEDNYWCFMNRMSGNGGKYSAIALVVFAYIVIPTTIFCCLNIIKRIHSVDRMLASVEFKSRYRTQLYEFCSEPTDGLELRPPSFFMNNLNQYRDGSVFIPSIAQQKIASNITKATRKMTSYIFLQLVQYTPIIIFCLCFLSEVNQSWIYILFIMFINLGGIIKIFTFLRFEIFTKQKKPHSKRKVINSDLTYPQKSHYSKKTHRLNSMITTDEPDPPNTTILIDNSLQNTTTMIDNMADDNESIYYKWCDNDIIIDDFLIPSIFSDQNFITSSDNYQEINSTKFTNRFVSESLLLNISPDDLPNNRKESFISTNESIPDPYFRYNGGDDSPTKF